MLNSAQIKQQLHFELILLEQVFLKFHDQVVDGSPCWISQEKTDLKNSIVQVLRELKEEINAFDPTKTNAVTYQTVMRKMFEMPFFTSFSALNKDEILARYAGKIFEIYRSAREGIINQIQDGVRSEVVIDGSDKSQVTLPTTSLVDSSKQADIQLYLEDIVNDFSNRLSGKYGIYSEIQQLRQELSKIDLEHSMLQHFFAFYCHLVQNSPKWNRIERSDLMLDIEKDIIKLETMKRDIVSSENTTEAKEDYYKLLNIVYSKILENLSKDRNLGDKVSEVLTLIGLHRARAIEEADHEGVIKSFIQGLSELSAKIVPLAPKIPLTQILDPSKPYGRKILNYVSDEQNRSTNKLNLALAMPNQRDSRILCRSMFWQSRFASCTKMLRMFTDYEAETRYYRFDPIRKVEFINSIITATFNVTLDNDTVTAMRKAARQSIQTDDNVGYQLYIFIKTLAEYRMLNKLAVELAIKLLTAATEDNAIDVYRKIKMKLEENVGSNCAQPAVTHAEVTKTEEEIMAMLTKATKDCCRNVKQTSEVEVKSTDSGSLEQQEAQLEKKSCCVM